MVPLYALALGFSVLTRLTFTSYVMGPNAYSYDVPLWAEMVMGLTMGITWLMVGAVFVMTFFMLVTKYFRSIYGDEGYLTNTLPITKHQIIITKVLSFYLWYALAAIIAVLCFFIMFSHYEMLEAIRYFFVDELWYDLMYYITPDYVQSAIYFLITMILAPAASALLIFVSTGIGARFRHKLTMSVVAYIVISFVLSTISQIAMVSMFAAEMYSDIFPALGFSIFTLVLTVLEIVGFYFATHYLLTKKLNLE